MPIRPTPPGLLISSQPVLHCCETWQVIAARGEVLPNRPQESETWTAIAAMRHASAGPPDLRLGQVVRMLPTASGGLMPRVVKRGGLRG